MSATPLLRFLRHPAMALVLSLATVGGVVGLVRHLAFANPTTAALGLLLAVLATATLSSLWVAVVAALASTLAFNFYFLPPVGTFSIAEPENWIALSTFLVVAVVASELSATAQARTREALARRNEVTRLFDLGRDILLTTDSGDALQTVAAHAAKRFQLDGVTIFLPGPSGWQRHEGGARPIHVDAQTLDRALEHRLGGETTGEEVTLSPLWFGDRAIGLLAIGRHALDASALDALAGLVAVAVERTQFLAERTEAQLVRQRADLSSALLASLSHDLRTPLTAARVAVANLQNESLPAAERLEQAALATQSIDRLVRLFDEILDMARIDAEVIRPDRQWLTPADIIDAAISHVRPSLDARALDIDAESARAVHVDPRLTSAALAHLLENAARYSPVSSPIHVHGWVAADGLRLEVTDHGPGLDPNEVPQLFDRFFRGRRAKATQGTGMGLAIARGLLAAEDGRLGAENVEEGGARFWIAVPSASQVMEAAD